MKKKISLFFFLLVFAWQTVIGQADKFETFIQKTEKAIENYSEVFKNLSAEETKTIKYFNNENLDETRIVKSLFIVYQSPRSGNISEFRNPLEFNGKNVSRSEEKIGQFFEKLTKSTSDGQEYKKLREESDRYDGRVHSWGITLFQTNPFGILRPFFEYQVVSRVKIEGRDVLVIEYRQSKPTLLIKVNATKEEFKAEPRGVSYDTSLPNDLRPTNPQMSGKIWLDAETGQIWRNEFKIAIKPNQLTQPVVTSEISYEYQSSKFGILVPKIFRFVSYEIKGKINTGLKVNKFADRSFEYSNFARIDTEVKKYEVEK